MNNIKENNQHAGFLLHLSLSDTEFWKMLSLRMFAFGSFLFLVAFS